MKKNLFFLTFYILTILLVIVILTGCSAGLVIGRSNRQYQETKTSVNADSSSIQPTITIR